jgi:hypothetical protein
MLESMAKKHNKPRPDKIPVQIRLPVAFRDALEKLAERNVTDLSAEIIYAIRRYLEEQKLWPPPGMKGTERRTGPQRRTP